MWISCVWIIQYDVYSRDDENEIKTMQLRMLEIAFSNKIQIEPPLAVCTEIDILFR